METVSINSSHVSESSVVGFAPDGQDSTNLLLTAAANGSVTQIRLILQQEKVGFCNQIVNEYGESPLYLAVENDHKKIAELLLIHGAKLDVPTTFGLTPLHRACDLGLYDMIKILLKYNADIQEKDAFGWMPLHYAARCGQVNVVSLLIEKSKNIVNAQTKDGTTALHLAVYHDKLECAKVLLLSGATLSLTMTKEGGITPLMLAASVGNEELVNLLIKYGTDVLVTDNNGNNAAVYAETSHFPYIAALLRPKTKNNDKTEAIAVPVSKPNVRKSASACIIS